MEIKLSWNEIKTFMVERREDIYVKDYDARHLNVYVILRTVDC